MKRILTVVISLIAIAFATQAQYRWGVVAGGEVSKFHFRQPLVPSSNAGGFSAGVMGEIMFPGIGFGIDAGLLYNMHGGKIDLGSREVWAVDGYGNEHLNVHTLQIPVNLKFKYTNLQGVERTIAPFVFGGPVFSFTLAHSDIKAFEFPAGSFALQCGLGAELIERIQISAGYYWGMSYEVRTVKLENFSAKPKGWMFKATYLF